MILQLSILNFRLSIFLAGGRTPAAGKTDARLHLASGAAQ